MMPMMMLDVSVDGLRKRVLKMLISNRAEYLLINNIEILYINLLLMLVTIMVHHNLIN